MTVWEIAPGDEVEVFRIVCGNKIDDPMLLNSLRSHYELSQEPRKVERRWTVLHMGISVYTTGEQAIAAAQRWPKLGDYVACVHLRANLGFNLARTGHAGHLTLWAEPVKLRDATTDINSIGEQS